MAVRLQLRLGVVAESDRLPDSPDRIVAVEPNIGSVARSKGSLYLVVTARTGGHRAREATRLVAQSIRDQYYYDESAGIRVCLVKAITAANKRLAHQRDRFGIALDESGFGPVGVAVAVVRGNELYVATVGPAEAYLIRQARLSTLPDPHRERGLPAGELEPEVWRGEIAVGDLLVLVSPNVVARLGPDELKEAMLTLHPQSAIEHLHHRFVAADGTGSDGALAVEATEVAATHKQRTLVPVRPAEPLAGAPDRSPIPLADSVTDGVAAVQASARSARTAASGFFERVVWRAQDLMPQRAPRHRRVTSLSTRRETQRRAAVALLALVAVVATLGFAVYFGPGGAEPEDLGSLTAGQRALQDAEGSIGQVFGDGIDLVRDDEPKALELLTTAYADLDDALAAGVPRTTVAPLRAQVIDGLDRIWNVVEVAPTIAFSFDAVDPPVDLAGLVRGPDGAPYVLDRTAKTVYRIDLKEKKATVVVRAGQAAAGTKVAEPRLLAVGGPDLLVLDAKNVLWRWRPANKQGKGTLTKVKVSGATSWGDDVRALGTYVRDAEKGLYFLYVVDPSERQVLKYSPAADGSGYPAAPSGYLATAQAVAAVTTMVIDGDVFLADGGVIERFVSGRTGDWELEPPGDELLREAPVHLLVATPTPKGEGLVYTYDPGNGRVLAFDKPSGAFREQYRLAGGDSAWADVRSMLVVPGAEGDPPTLWWIDRGRLMRALLVAVEEDAAASPVPGASASAAPEETPAEASTAP